LWLIFLFCFWWMIHWDLARVWILDFDPMIKVLRDYFVQIGLDSTAHFILDFLSVFSLPLKEASVILAIVLTYQEIQSLFNMIIFFYCSVS
jgi:hypothetical protein